jgi:glycosyltransferase involved in cell wall biosynthesis
MTEPESPASRKRLLISAFAFDSAGGSEAGLGWQITRRLARDHDVTVLFGNLRPGPRDAENLRQLHAACDAEGGIRAIFIEGSPFAKSLAAFSHKPGFWWLYYRAYRLWQQQALGKARELHSEKPFDLVHHVNIIGYREPGYLWQLGIPFFWGPLSGSPMVPWAFLKTFGPGQFYRWGSRNLANAWQMRTSRRCKAAARAATKIWAVSESDRRMVIDLWGCDAEHLLETGGEPATHLPLRSRQPEEPLRILWSGRFDPIKVLPVMLDALSGITAHPWELHILGDGPEKPRWKRHESQTKLTGSIHWHGMVPRAKALEIMASGHVFVHTSVKEGTPHVVVEALCLGVPVICHDACGMGIAVDERCGLKIPLIDPATSARGFREALLRLLEEPEMLETLSRGAFQRAAELDWDTKVATFARAYRKAQDNHP